MRARTRFIAVVVACIAVVGWTPMPAVAVATSKDMIKCHKALAQSVTKFFATKEKQVGKCTDALFSCQIKETIDVSDQAKCFAKAKTRCEKSLGKLADPRKSLAAKMRATWEKRCAKVPLEDLTATVGGLGYDTPAALCAMLGPVAQRSDLFNCMQYLLDAVADAIAGLLKPRTCELLLAQGLEDHAALQVVPQLWNTVVTEQLNAGGKDVWSLSVSEDTAFFVWVDNMDDGGGMSNLRLETTLRTATDTTEGDTLDCSHPILLACGSALECPIVGELQGEGGETYFIDVEDLCGQGAGGYTMTVVAVGTSCGAPQPVLTFTTDDDP